MTDEETAIRQMVDKWMAANNSGDWGTILDLVADDVIFTTPGQEPFGREVFAMGAEQGPPPEGIAMDGQADVIEVEVLSDVFALIRARISLDIKQDGAIVQSHRGFTSSVLKKGDDGQWRLWRDGNCVMPVTPSA